MKIMNYQSKIRLQFFFKKKPNFKYCNLKNNKTLTIINKVFFLKIHLCEG